MKRAVIIEDEKKASEYLAATIKEIDPAISIVATLDSVESSIRYFSSNGKVDLIFSDVQLTDGLSFSIFNALDIQVPIIFVTGYDRFMMDAFENNGIDYLLKPVSKDDLQKALKKYNSLERHFMANRSEDSMSHLMYYINSRKRTRILVRKGVENITLLLSDVVLFYTENKVVYAIDKQGKKFLVDKNLTDLERELDTNTFFRANRQYILNINYIKSFKPYERVKLWVELTTNDTNHSIIISQETARLCRK